MCFALFNAGGGEIILTLTLVLILLGAKRLPEIVEQLLSKRSNEPPSPSTLKAMTVILGAVCLILVLYEFSK
jgi:hypothetical protein